jgi:hypothetical protein
MKTAFYRIVTLVAGLALLLDGLALVDFLLHPLAGDYKFHSALYRAVTVLGLVPLTLLVAFLIIRRVPGNVVGPLLIVWSGTVANTVRVDIGPALFSLYYAYDIVFGWMALFLLFLHFPDGKIYPPGIGRWVYRMLVPVFIATPLVVMSTDPLPVPAHPANLFAVPALLPYAEQILVIGLLMVMPILLLIPISFVLRYRKVSLLARQQMKWLALFGGLLTVYSILALIVVPLLTSAEVMDPGPGTFAMFFYFISGLFPPLAIGISVLRYRLWDIDRILRRTLVYTLLTAALALLYFGSVVVLQTLFTFLFQRSSNDLVIVLSTLAIAAAFTPLRGRIQRSIDRRFFRQKYNFDQTIARFAATARSEVVIEPLAGALVDNVETSLHPEGVSLWLVARRRITG